MNKRKAIQGELIPVIRNDGSLQMISVFINSLDFPNYDIIVMSLNDKHQLTERIPINEEIWRRIGIALNYRFRKKGEKL